ncbi:MAG: class I SAM-dependent methyltransferase [Leptospiraceae bacterium]|nr:class I SAM-dependent methyltransferase [Leptospiraceae bacterium]
MNPVSFWNERYQNKAYYFGTAPNHFIQHTLDQIGPVENQTLIELGCGEGRNSVYAAGMGYAVTATDVADIGLQKTRALADSNQVELTTRIFDILQGSIQAEYDMVILSFVHMPPEHKNDLYQCISSLCKPGGCVIAEWYHPRQRLDGYSSGGPQDPAMMVTLSELEEVFNQQPWHARHIEYRLDHLHEGQGHVGLAALSRLYACKES